MPHQFIEAVDLPYVEIIHDGRITKDDIKNCRQKIQTIINSGDPIYVLCDLFKAEFKATIADMYYGPESFTNMKLSKSSRIAILLTENHISWREIKFLETVSTNRGWRLQIFTDKEKAIDWLTL